MLHELNEEEKERKGEKKRIRVGRCNERGRSMDARQLERGRIQLRTLVKRREDGGREKREEGRKEKEWLLSEGKNGKKGNKLTGPGFKA